MTDEQFDYLYNKAKELLKNTRDPNHDWQHMQRVEENALRIKKLLGVEIDERILRIASAWHDISYAFYKANVFQFILEGPRGARKFKRYANQAGVNRKETELLSDIIWHHDIYKESRLVNRKRSAYHKIIQDADFLEEFNEGRMKNAQKMAESSLYWRFVIKIIKPIFFNWLKKNKDKFLNFKQVIN